MKPVWLVLHGAIGAEDQLIPLKKLLENDCDVHTLSFSGHGTNAHQPVDFSMELFSKDVINFMNEHSLDCANIFGYSMGGYAAMYLAKHHSEYVNRIVTLGTKFEWNEEISAKEVRMLNPEKIEQKIPQFANVLAGRHGSGNWKSVLERTQKLLLNLGNKNPLEMEDYGSIQQETTILWAENDAMVSREEGELVANKLPNGKFAIISNSEHPIEKVDLKELLKYFR